MTDRAANHEMIDSAVMYSLGALPQHEAQSFEAHLAGGCDVCKTELKSFDLTVNALAFSTPDERPPDGVRTALLATVGTPQMKKRA